jgi:hypothetical protein
MGAFDLSGMWASGGAEQGDVFRAPNKTPCHSERSEESRRLRPFAPLRVTVLLSALRGAVCWGAVYFILRDGVDYRELGENYHDEIHKK